MREQLGKNVFRTIIPFKRNRDWEHWTLFISDMHWDNPHCKRDLLKKHLDLAKERGADIVSVGDAFCAMQGKYDKRKSKSAIRPEHQEDNYLDALVHTAVKWFEPYQANMFVWGQGNHETAIKGRHETDLTERFVACSNMRGAKMFNGQYGGYVLYRFEQTGNQKKKQSRTMVVNYFHGNAGGGGPTAGMGRVYRRAGYTPDADIILTGHTHDSWLRELIQLRIDKNSGVVRHKPQTIVRIGTYKDEIGSGASGWSVETGKDPKPTGGWWCRWHWDSPTQEIQYQLSRAK